MLVFTDYLPTTEHIEIFLAGSTFLGIIAHAVNTFPTPADKYGQWFLGVVKYVVGQRLSAAASMKGEDLVIASVPRGTGTGGATTEVKKSSVEVSDGTVTVKDLKQTTTVIPKPPTTGTGE